MWYVWCSTQKVRSSRISANSWAVWKLSNENKDKATSRQNITICIWTFPNYAWRYRLHFTILPFFFFFKHKQENFSLLISGSSQHLEHTQCKTFYLSLLPCITLLNLSHTCSQAECSGVQPFQLENQHLLSSASCIWHIRKYSKSWIVEKLHSSRQSLLHLLPFLTEK